MSLIHSIEDDEKKKRIGAVLDMPSFKTHASYYAAAVERDNNDVSQVESSNKVEKSPENRQVNGDQTLYLQAGMAIQSQVEEAIRKAMNNINF